MKWPAEHGGPFLFVDGQGEIRTLDTGFTGMPVFETGAFSHSATCPYRLLRSFKS